MFPAFHLSSSDPDHSAARRRVTALVLTIVFHILLLIMLLTMAPYTPKLPGVLNKLVTFNVLPEAQTPSPRAKASASSKAVHRAPPPAPTQTMPPTLFKNAPTPWVLTPGLEKYTIKQTPVTTPVEREEEQASTEEDSAYTGGSGNAVYGPSQDGRTGGGGGERLYYAEWYREPTDAELAYYLPKENHNVGYGEVACQTIEKYHVDNCRDLAEYPAGTGLARAVRQAAWQFLIRPPHIGGKPLIGAWVRIRITYTETRAEIDKSRRR